MQVTTEQIDPCKIALTISVEPDKVNAAKEKAFGQFARNVQVPGFRKGKVPPHMARAYVDPDRVKQRAMEMLVEPAYAEALEETKVEPFAQPELELVEMNDAGPFVFKALVPLRPVVTLGMYKGLAAERRRLQVGDADVDRQIEELRNRSAEFEEVEGRAAQTGDIAFADLAAEIEGQDAGELKTPRATAIEIGKNIPDFDNGLVGMAVGETKTIEAVYPEEFADESMRGKRATFTVTLTGLRTRKLPELDDAFAEAQKAYPEAKTLDALRSAIREGLERAADEIAGNDLEVKLVNEVVSTSQISYPEVLLRAEIEQDARQLQERLERDSRTLEDYLEATGKSREEIEQELSAAGDRRIRNSLILSEIARAENITVEEADIDQEFQERADRAKVSVAAVRAFVEKNEGMDAIRNRALTQKVLRFLKDSAQITEKVVTEEELAAEANQGTGDNEIAVAAGETSEPLPVEQTAPTARRGGRKAKAAAESAAAEAPAGESENQ